MIESKRKLFQGTLNELMLKVPCFVEDKIREENKPSDYVFLVYVGNQKSSTLVC